MANAALTPHFTLEELTRTSVKAPNKPNATELTNIIFTANQLEQIRAMLGGPLAVTSCFRSEAVNKAVGGSPTSAHRYGLAADFTCASFGSPRDIVNLIIKSGIEFDQIILEFPSTSNPGGQWVHIGFSKDKPRKQVLTAKKTDGGKTVYLKGVV